MKKVYLTLDALLSDKFRRALPNEIPDYIENDAFWVNDKALVLSELVLFRPDLNGVFDLLLNDKPLSNGQSLGQFHLSSISHRNFAGLLASIVIIDEKETTMTILKPLGQWVKKK